MQNPFELTDIERSFLQKATLVVKSRMANDILSGNLSTNDTYIDILKKWMWKTLNINDSRVRIIESYPNKYMKFSGVNPHTIIREMNSGLDDLLKSTERELEEGTESWSRAYSKIKDFIGQYPLECFYNINLPENKIEVILPGGFSINVNITRGKSPVNMDNLATKVSDYLSSYLTYTMDQKNLELKVEFLQQHLKLNELGIEWEFKCDGNYFITLILWKDEIRRCTHTVNIHYYEPLPIFKEFVDQFISGCDKYESSKQYLADLLQPLGFELEFDSYNLSCGGSNQYIDCFTGDIRVHVRRNDEYDLAICQRFDSLSSQSGRNDFQKRFSFALKTNTMIRDYLQAHLSGKDVSWEFNPGIDYSKLIIESYEKTIIVSSVSESNIDKVLGNLMNISDRMSEIATYARECFKDLNVDYRISIDFRNNITLTVSLPGFPKLVKTISQTKYRRDILSFSDLVFHKKKILHIL